HRHHSLFTASYFIYHCSPHSSVFSSLFFQLYVHHRDLHSFPTRRSSDLDASLLRLEPRRRPGHERHLRQHAPGGRNLRLRGGGRSEEHTSELQSRVDLVCRLLLEKKKKKKNNKQRRKDHVLHEKSESKSA